MSTTTTTPTTAKLLDLATMALDFGRVERATAHPDGVTPETDTTHTVMLGWIACAFAARHFPTLDLGLVAQFALLHDAPEVIAGDVNSFSATPEEMAAKHRDEAAAVEEIVETYADTFPWVGDTLVAYEAQELAEARYVRAMDKLLPLLTQCLNGMAGMRAAGVTYAQLASHYRRQIDEIALYASDFPELFSVRAELVGITLGMLAASRPAMTPPTSP